MNTDALPCRIHRWRGAVLTVLVLWGVYLFVASRSTLWDRDEPRYATATLEMMHSGNLLYPTFNGVLRPHKPVLIYWLMLGAMQVFGPTAWAARFPSTVAMALAALLVYDLGRRLLSPRAAWWAVVVLCTSLLAFLNAAIATTDAVLLLCILLSLYPFVRAYTGGPRPWHLPLMGLGLGAALLAKGPVGLVLPVLSMIVALVWARGRSQLPRRYGWTIGAAVLIGLALFLAWALPANEATAGEYYRDGVVDRLSRRLFTAMEGHGGSSGAYVAYLPFYLVVLYLGTFPWTLLLPAAVTDLWRRRLGDTDAPWARSPAGVRALLTAMIVPTVVFMTLVVSKLPHYVLPVFPWVALLVGGALDRRLTTTGPPRPAWRHGVWGFGLLGVGLAAAMAVGPWFISEDVGVRAWCVAAGLLALGATVLTIRFQWSGRYGRAAWSAGAGLLAALLCLQAAMPTLERALKIEHRLAARIQDRLRPGVPLAQHAWFEPSLHFSLGAPMIHRLHNPEALRVWAAQDGPGLLVLPRRELRRIEEEGGALPLREIAAESGYSYVKGRPLELVALARGNH